MKCTECNEEVYTDGASMSTCVAYMSPAGHNHDDNCNTRVYRCENGHSATVSVINKCSYPGCGWEGKTSCFCCGDKLDEWPD